MAKELNKGFLKWIGAFYILISLAAYFNAFYYGRPYDVFWFCYVGILLIGIGMLRADSSLIKSQLYILMIPDIIWTLDFASYFFLGHTAFGIVNYFFISGPLFPKIITMQHLFTVPLALFVFYKLKLKRNDMWLASCFQLALIYTATRIFTSEGFNINCVYHACGKLSILPTGFAYYPLVWIFLGVLMVLLTRILLMELPFLWKPRIEDV